MDVTTRYGLADLMFVANTRHGPGGHHHARAREDGPDHDHLVDPADAHAFLSDHGMEVPKEAPDGDDLRRLRSVREAVRGHVERGRPISVPAPLGGYALDESGRVRAAAPGWDGVIDELRLPLIELARRPEGLKRCGNPLCRWVFVDGSRNRSRRWCDMAACGNRAKVARHRAMARAS